MSHASSGAGSTALASICLVATFCAEANCDAAPGVTRAEGRTTVVAFKTQPAQIKVGEVFTLDATVCAKSGAALAVSALKVDATMPAHRHGMNYQPSVVKKEGAYHVSGLVFHMPGSWQFGFDVDTAVGRERVVSSYQLD